ncbi:hypothetical protein Dda_8770 [Drechslerella dactyloides]|uniref:Uncharacterized protein n=1 Tax=Drechslerella dactyloides TaxID=74499 RepID=A0AAD6IQ24_DREDA|nr:hypothetical protein Dda_8770 [Drechslerella dactyloides]
MASHGSLKRPPPHEPMPDSPTKKPRGMDSASMSAADSSLKSPAMLALEQKKRMMEEARARASALAASLGSRGSAPAATDATNALSSKTSQSQTYDAAKRRADLKAQVAAAANRLSSSNLPNAAPISQTTESRTQDQAEASQDNGRGRGGLDIGLHPALLADSMETTSSVGRGRHVMKPKFATTMANQKTDSLSQLLSHQKGGRADITKQSLESAPSKNPYFDPNITSETRGHQKGRVSKGLVFNQKGKFIEQANALRKQAKLEELKRRIATAARRAGIEEEMDTDKLFLVRAPVFSGESASLSSFLQHDPPPDVEWWDLGLCANGTYDDMSSDNLKITSEDSIITIYIQHPILLDPPMEKHIPAAKPLPLTKREQKKARLQNRSAVLKENQAKVRLGLEPAPPPKVTMKNMMRVYNEEAVRDPTAVEARVKKQIAERLEKHLTANEERKLTKEQKLEKLHTNQEKDLAKGVHCLVFRIENLSNPAHQFKIWKNAEQLSLTGICIHNPKFNLVVVEGGQWAINKYRKLMLQRIKWTELSGGADSDIETEPSTVAATTNMESNTCRLVWEGELKIRGFKRFTTNKCESEGEVRKLLERNKVENYWTLAKAKGPSQA